MSFLSWFTSFLPYLYSPGFKRQEVTKRWITGAATVLVACVLLWGLSSLGHWRAVDVPADSVDFEAAIQARVMYSKLGMALVLLVAVPAITILEWQILDRTRLWARLTHWTEFDGPETEGAKTLGAGLMFGLLFLGNIILLSAVLR